MDEKKIKVTDRRMFTPEGELREDFKHLDRPPSPPPPSGEPRPTTEPRPAAAESPPLPPRGGELGFVELVGVLAEPIALFLGDAPLPDGGSAENLEMARQYIDLLAVLRDKTAGNLTAREQELIDELLHGLRLRYVEKRG